MRAAGRRPVSKQANKYGPPLGPEYITSSSESFKRLFLKNPISMKETTSLSCRQLIRVSNLSPSVAQRRERICGLIC